LDSRPDSPSPASGERALARALQGEVEVVTFHNPESLYTVLRLRPEPGYGDPEGGGATLFGARAVAVGQVVEPAEGQRLRLEGQWVSNRRHGRQFEFELCTSLPPADARGLVRYLASKAFEGIGEVLAARIATELGERALERIRHEPEALRAVPGLRPKVREALVQRVREDYAAHELRAFLLGVGLGLQQAQAVARKLGPDCEARLRANPYLLASGIRGLGFLTADRVARQLGVAPDSAERARAALVHVLESAAGEGHSLLEAADLLAQAHALVGGADSMPLERLRAGLHELEHTRELVLERELRPDAPLVYLPMLHACEAGLARSLERLLAAPKPPPLAEAAQLARAESEARIEFHPLQREAVLGLLGESLALLSGGPGVGKTTIVNFVVALAEAAGAKVALASPTGRAAKRLAEATGREARTIHRLLGFDPVEGRFARDAQRPLEIDLLVVDEISMLDVVLAHQLFKAIRPPTRVVLVGDPDQLPSVSAGNVLSDLLASRRVPLWRLTQIYRQEGHSRIVENAHRILRGEWPALPEQGEPLSDFYWFPAEDERGAAERVVEVVTQRIPQRFGLQWTADVQVLAPMYRGECGVDALNARLREALAHDAPQVRLRGQVWRVGDRVIHTRNDYEKEVFNGDMGRIRRILPEGEGLVVAYPEQEVVYAPDELGDLQLAFAITVHRSQGGEFPAVVIPLVTQHYPMLQRHLLYTAVTRARKLVVLVGGRRALQLALDNAQQRYRQSALGERLIAAARSEGAPQRED